jgi:hypothetical protein
MSEHAVLSLVLLALLLVPPAMIVAARFGGRPSAAARLLVSRLAPSGEPGRRTRTPAALTPAPPPAVNRDAEERARLMAAPRQRLYDLARTRGIEGRSRMGREQLVEALLARGPD